MPALRQSGDNRLRWPGRLKIAQAIGETDHAVSVRDIDVTRGSRRLEGNPKGLVETIRKYADLRLSVPLSGTENANAARPAFRDEKVAARRNPDQARVVETGSQELDDKTSRCFRPGIGRALHYRRTLLALALAYGGGISAGVILRRTPGASLRQSP